MTTRKKKTRKAPGALDPAVVLPSPPGGVKYDTVTKDNHPVLACVTKSVMRYFDHSVTQPGLVAQLVERRCSNQEVVGSNPAGVKNFSFTLVLTSNFFF